MRHIGESLSLLLFATLSAAAQKSALLDYGRLPLVFEPKPRGPRSIKAATIQQSVWYDSPR